MTLNNNLRKILIIDFGSQFTQLIARRIRELGVYSEIINHKKIKVFLFINLIQKRTLPNILLKLWFFVNYFVQICWQNLKVGLAEKVRISDIK